jgi:hypothetical protein
VERLAEQLEAQYRAAPRWSGAGVSWRFDPLPEDKFVRCGASGPLEAAGEVVAAEPDRSAEIVEQDVLLSVLVDVFADRRLFRTSAAVNTAANPSRRTQPVSTPDTQGVHLGIRDATQSHG